jgi:predicted nucleic acid-binding protein
MNIIYFDTSALVKEFHTEKGTEIVSFIFENIGNCVFATSTLSVIEFTAAMRRKLKAGIINEREYKLCVESFIGVIIDRFVFDTLDNHLVGSLLIIDAYALKSADAVHLSTANAFREEFKHIGKKFIFATADVELANAAKEDGFTVINPEIENIEYVKKSLGTEV